MIDWLKWDALLGKHVDSVVAKKICAATNAHCTREVIRRRRRKLGVGPHRGYDPECTASNNKVDWDKYAFYLGEMGDGTLVRKIKAETGVTVSVNAVRGARNARGIPAFAGHDPGALHSNVPAYKQAAERRGMTYAAYMQRVNNNEKYCPRCTDWHLRSDFPRADSARGKLTVCNAYRDAKKEELVSMFGVSQ